MLETILSWLEGFGLDPRLVVAITVGLIASWAITQTVKSLVKHFTRYALHGWTARIAAFVVGFSATFTIIDDRDWLAFWVAFAVGIGSPTAYKILQAVAGKRWRWVRELSGERHE